jgi:hypothetical protein
MKSFYRETVARIVNLLALDVIASYVLPRGGIEASAAEVIELRMLG